MPYDEEEITALTPGVQFMMAKLALAGYVFDKWATGGCPIYCIDQLHLEELKLDTLVCKAWVATIGKR